LSHPASSRAILIGSAKYDHLEHLPAVTADLDVLRKTMIDPAIWGIPDAHCRTLPDPDNPQLVLKAIGDAAAAATDTLIVYLAGHLLEPEPNGEVYFALSSSDAENAYRSALPYSLLRRAVRTARARWKVVIVDAVYRNPDGWRAMGGSPVAQQLGIDGTYIIVAAATDSQHFAPSPSRLSIVTDDLIRTLKDGVPDGPALLDMETLADSLDARLRERKYPGIQRIKVNSASSFAFARNVHRYARLPVSGEGERAPKVTNLDRPEPASKPWLGLALIGLAVWVYATVSVALSHDQRWWLAIPAITGALLPVALRIVYWLVKRVPTTVSFYLVIAPLVLAYLVWAVLGPGNWLTSVTILGVLAAYAWTAFCWAAGWQTNAWKYKRDLRILEQRLRLAKVVRATPWITGEPADEVVAGIRCEISDIPSARFAEPPGDYVHLVVVAGRRVLLISLAAEPEDTSERALQVIGEIADWCQDVLEDVAATVQAVVVELPDVQAAEIHRDFAEQRGIGVSSRENLGQFARDFLADGAFEIDMAVVERVYHLVRGAESRDSRRDRRLATSGKAKWQN
jgi:Caspase domain